MTKINYKSDFDFLLRLRDSNGLEIGWPDYNWSARFWTSIKANAVEVSCRDGVAVNCYNDNGVIHVVMNNHHLVPGTLRMEFIAELPNDIYPDESERVVIPMPLDIELISDAAPCPKEIEIEAFMPYIRGEAFTYEDFTPEQIAELQRPATEAAQLSINATNAATNAANDTRKFLEDANAEQDSFRKAESARVEAESARKENETNRQTAESNRVSAENIRQRDEDVRVANEVTRKSAETIRERNETTRRSDENNRALAEDRRNTAENDRTNAENNRVSAEDIRQKNETNRMTNETTRKSAETAREQSESARQSAEDVRESTEDSRNRAETERSNAESNRVSAEDARKNAETDRATAEATRNTAETTREQNESVRKSAENSRANAEKKREDAEKLRETAEQTRKTNENGRVGAEQSRVSAETSRVNAETARVNAENARAKEFAGFEGEIASKQNKLNSSNDVLVNDNDSLSVTEKVKREVFNDLWIEWGGTVKDSQYSKDGATFDYTKAKRIYSHKELIDMWLLVNQNSYYINLGKFNYDTELFSLYTLNDITYEQAQIIYSDTLKITTEGPARSQYKGRTNMLIDVWYNGDLSTYKFYSLANIEVICLQVGAYLGNSGATPGANVGIGQSVVRQCPKLREIIGRIYPMSNNALYFDGCKKLEDVDFALVVDNRRQSFSMAECPLLSLLTMQKLTMYGDSTSKHITITVHPDVYAKLTDESNAEWHKVLTDGAAKNISFATI